MEEYTPTQKQIEKHVKSAFDSVDLINALLTKSNLDEQDNDDMDRNVKHLKIMMAYEWFASALTSEQELQINAIING